MVARLVHSRDAIEKAVKRYMAGEQVTALAKEFKVSVPGLYLWIKKAKEQAAEHAKYDGMGTGAKAQDQVLKDRMSLAALRAENEKLKKALFNLMLETGKL